MKGSQKKTKSVKSRKSSKSVKKRSKAPHKEKTKIMLPEMITPSKKRSAEQITIDDIRSASQNDLHLKAGDGIEIRLTPKGVLLAAVDKHYGAGEDLHKFDEFMKDICQHLSMLATNDQQPDMFGDDFNSLFDMLVSSMNLAGKMKEVLDENGIEFNVTEFLKSIGSDCGDITSADMEEDGDDEIMPRRKK